MGCSQSSVGLQEMRHEYPSHATLFRMTGNDFCPYNERTWTITQFELGVAQNGQIVGKAKYRSQDCPILGNWDSNQIMYRMPYYNENKMNIYRYIGKAQISTGIMRGKWYCEEMPNSGGHQGHFNYQFYPLQLESNLVPKGCFNVVGWEISESGKIFATESIQLEGFGEYQFKGVALYKNSVDGYIRSQFIGNQVAGALFMFELKYGDDIYIYKGMRYSNDIMGRWVSKYQPNNWKKQGSFLWHLSP